MTIVLNHTIIPAADKYAAAQFFADLVGLSVADQGGPFVPVHVNDELTLDFDDRQEFSTGHYAFLIDESTFDHLLERLEQSGIGFGAGPEVGWNRGINHLGGGRGVYVQDPNGHSFEFFTHVPEPLK
ncbi:MAG: VOC family protein [Chloroflexi bacterium]|nr:VOC family protein [Chloroflexota bacterium]